MPHDISLKTLHKFLEKVPWTSVLQKAENTPKGNRVFPSRSPKNDSSNNFRRDRGSDVDGKPELVLQANRNAEDKKLKQAAQKDSHAILAKCVIDPSGIDVRDQITADFEKRKSS
ncbi:hypothetical protein LTR62_001406 [Meristemomyces frigidus]|uniref:Uncharacterized protein n=1 Tax=Meristemomyces frigidus TaxID=1508187 RepID=A0AAN7T989_9PEZI|nr:hypothetical protein LTR62_001406 [Meristemomyces frigidus]